MHIQYVEYIIALNITHIILFSCTLHIIHLVTKQCINAIYPIPPGRAASRDNDEGGEESWEAGNLLGKVLVLIKQVSLLVLFLDQNNYY